MKKVLILLLFILTLCGCEYKSKYNEMDINKLFDTFLANNTNLANHSTNGYKYYLPRGVKVVKSKEYNEELYSNGNYYYLYIDAVGYFYKNNIDYELDDSLYFSKSFDYNNKTGYANIKKENDKYIIYVYYNYASIETYASEENLKNSIVNICYILNSIKFNDSITNYAIGDDRGKLKEETFDFYVPKKEGNFIDYINKYDEYVDEKNTEGNIGKQVE